MIYLVDANVVMEAANTYYRHAWVPEFWMWMRHHADAGIIKMPIEIFSEIKDGTKDGTKDELFSWATDKGNKAALLLATEASPRSHSGSTGERLLDRPYRRATSSDRPRSIPHRARAD